MTAGPASRISGSRPSIADPRRAHEPDHDDQVAPDYGDQRLDRRCHRLELGGDQAESVPAVLPAAADAGSPLVHDVVAAGLAGLPAHRETGLTAADDDGLDGRLTRIVEPVRVTPAPHRQLLASAELRLVVKEREDRRLKSLASWERIGLAGSPGLRQPALGVV